MKKIILFVIALLMSLSFVLAAPPNFPVDISYTDSSTDGKHIVADVPFDVIVNMDTSSNDVLSYNLYVTSTDSRALFTSASRGQLFPQNDLDANSGVQPGNAIYRYQVKPKVGYVGNSADKAVSIFMLKTKISGIAPSTVELKRDGTAIHADNVITPAANGASISAINDATRTITPSLSTCGDGVVGYIDSDSDGIFDNNQDGTVVAGEEIQEACDDGNRAGSSSVDNYNNAKDGCSSDCRIIDLGYSCGNTKFGDRGSSCDKIPAKELLIQKITALINGHCYPESIPQCTHPAALYKNTEAGSTSNTARITYDQQGNLDSSEKIYIISQLGAALREFFRDISASQAGS